MYKHKKQKPIRAKEGTSLRQFITEQLSGLNESKGRKKHKNASDKEFNALLKEFLVEKAPMIKRLSKI